VLRKNRRKGSKLVCEFLDVGFEKRIVFHILSNEIRVVSVEFLSDLCLISNDLMEDFLKDLEVLCTLSQEPCADCNMMGS
jgi:hypothetical protein